MPRVSARSGDRPGWRERAEKRATIPKDVTFVFDTSGSMRGEKIHIPESAPEPRAELTTGTHA